MTGMDYAEIDRSASRLRLQVFGGFHPGEDDPAPPGTRTLLMLGPLEPEFWLHVTSSDEFHDGKPNPLDRWSLRTIGRLAEDTESTALFPFGGPPWLPFYSWALRTGRCWVSPVEFLVHDTAGLFVSFRGALAFAERIELPPTQPRSPCETCAGRPCIGSCPAGALDDSGYDSGACISHIGSAAGTDCLMRGCAVRRACPVSAGFPRSEEQSRFHQEALLRQRGAS